MEFRVTWKRNGKREYRDFDNKEFAKTFVRVLLTSGVAERKDVSVDVLVELNEPEICK